MAKQKFRAIWDNRWFDAATLTSSSAAPGFPAVNVQDKVRSRPWRTTGLSDQYLTIDFGESLYCTCLALISHNLTFAAKVRVQASEDPAFGTLLKDDEYDAWADIIGFGEGGFGAHGFGGVIPEADRAYYAPNPIRIIYFEPAAGEDQVQARYWRLRFTDPANPDGYLQVGRIYLTGYDEYRYDWAFPWDLGGEDPSGIVYSPSGQPWTDKRPVQRAVRFGWTGFSDEDKYWRFYFMVMKLGLAQDWLIDPIPAGVSARWFTTLYGRFKELPNLAQQFVGISEMEIKFIESL